MDKIDFNPNGIKIYFNDEEHKYTTDNVKDFTSVTTLIGEFFEEFDTEKISYRYALKHDLTQAAVKAAWDYERDIASVKGTNVHDYCEKILEKFAPNTAINEEETLYFKSADKAIEMVLEKYELINTERIIFSEKYKISGMIDLIMKKGNTIYLIDWKTNKKIVTDNKWFNYGLGPCKIIADNNFMHYCLQLNLYKWILLKEEYYNCDIDMRIIHILKDGFTPYDIPDMQGIVTEMIKSRSI